MANDFKMFDSFDNRVSLAGTLTALTALRVGAGRATGVTGTDLPVVRNAFGRPYIPGSSFKGALRASVEALVRSVSASRRAACNPLNPDEWCVTKPEGVTAEEFQELIDGQTCLVCHVFGSPWLASKVNVRDLPVEGMWVDQYEVRNGVGIDRDTGTAAEGLLYDFEVVPAGTAFSCKIVVENADGWELGLLMMALRPFELGEAALGGARSRGLGAVELKWRERTQVAGGEGLLDYLAGEAPPAIDGKIGEWVGSFRERLKGVAHA
ncbi:MAG TPA: CRISPR-associated RAMP protein Csx7 [Pyrinomonadaceae bacterium]|nr:CRISPR-associated RAMP protein Csx7 [Pyrinomonadaceae bacterium]